MKVSSLVKLVGALLVAILVFSFGTSIFGHNVAGETQVLQSPGGELTVRTSPGWYFQGLNKAEDYKQNVSIGLGSVKASGAAHVDAVVVTFNDLAKADMSGLVRIKLPLDPDKMVQIRKQYSGGYEHFIENGIAPVVQNAFRIAANLRGSQESATTLALFQQDIEDQLKNGMYVTKLTVKTLKDPTGKEESVRVTEVLKDANGVPVRQPHSLMILGCEVTQVQIEVPDFEEAVQQAIAARRQQSLETETARQKAIRAEQDALTAAKEGEALVAKEKARKDVEKMAAVTDAEKLRDVAKLDKEQAEYYKQKLILEGEGEATKQKLILAANGNMNLKLDKWLEAQKVWANALSTYKGNIVPNYVNGGSGGNGVGGNAFQQFQELQAMKAMRDLNLDMSNK